jgi:hypothetical protein
LSIGWGKTGPRGWIHRSSRRYGNGARHPDGRGRDGNGSTDRNGGGTGGWRGKDDGDGCRHGLGHDDRSRGNHGNAGRDHCRYWLDHGSGDSGDGRRRGGRGIREWPSVRGKRINRAGGESVARGGDGDLGTKRWSAGDLESVPLGDVRRWNGRSVEHRLRVGLNGGSRIYLGVAWPDVVLDPPDVSATPTGEPAILEAFASDEQPHQPNDEDGPNQLPRKLSRCHELPFREGR